MLTTIESQKVILTEEEKAYLAKISDKEIENFKKCLDRDRERKSTTTFSDGTSVGPYNDLHKRQGTYWPTYDDPEKDKFTMIGRRQFAETMLKHVTIDKNTVILDIGAGTGYLAAAVKRCGFLNIDCMEPSPSLLDMQPVGLYGKVYSDVISISKPCNIETGTYDCAIMFGVTNTGHLEVEDFPELLRIIKPGGFVVFTLSDFWCKYKDYGLRLDAFLQENLETGILQYVVKDRFSYVFRIEDATLYVLKKC